MSSAHFDQAVLAGSSCLSLIQGCEQSTAYSATQQQQLAEARQLIGLSWANLALSTGRPLPAMPLLSSCDQAKVPAAVMQATSPAAGAVPGNSPITAVCPVASVWWALSPGLASGSLQQLSISSWPQHHTRLLQAIVRQHAPAALAPFQAISGPAAGSAAWTPSTDTLLSAARRALQATCQHLGLLTAANQGRCGPLHSLLHPAAATMLAAHAANLHGPHAAVAVLASWVLERPVASRCFPSTPVLAPLLTGIAQAVPD